MWPRLFTNDAFRMMSWSDYIPPTLKTIVFGFIIGTVPAIWGIQLREERPGGPRFHAQPDQQFELSRQRALAVQEYLESKFHIDPKFIGAIPFGSRAPRSAGREMWDGVCLVLVVSK